jgi:hypothetical protein
MASDQPRVDSTALVGLAQELDEYCPSCGEWVNYLSFSYEEGWCHACVGSSEVRPTCRRCGDVLPDGHGRTTCPTCRLELWYIKYEDEVEYLMVAKGYTLGQAKLAIVKMVRPICQECGKPIKGGREGDLFHKGNNNRKCHSAYLKFARLRRSGLTNEAALAMLHERPRG